MRIGQEGSGDHDAVGEVVEGIAHQDGHAATARFLAVMAVVVVVPIPFVMVRVAQQRDLFQQEETKQAGQQGTEQGTRIGAGLEGLGQGMQQRRGQQHPHRETHHALDHAGCHRQRQQRRAKDTAHPRDGGGKQDIDKRGIDDGLLGSAFPLAGSSIDLKRNSVARNEARIVRRLQPVLQIPPHKSTLAAGPCRKRVPMRARVKPRAALTRPGSAASRPWRRPPDSSGGSPR